MSRISGFLTKHDLKIARSQCHLVNNCLVQVGWKTEFEESKKIVMAWSGWQDAKSSHDRGCLAVVDGNFYNTEELCSLVEMDQGGEASLLVGLFRKYGFDGSLNRINGDFAVALYDEQTGDLWLGRDRVGHRPIYYAETSLGIGFASKPGALLSLVGMPIEINQRFVAIFGGSHYRYFDNEPVESPFANIFQVPAATVVRLSNGRRQAKQYWQLSDKHFFEESESDLAEAYRDLLKDAVGRRVKAFHKPAFTLSGGMDSSSVLSCAVEVLGNKLSAFSSVYSDKTYDESDEIKGFLTHKVDQWHPVPIEGFDLFETVRKMVRVHDEPVATATWLSHFLLCEAVKGKSFDGLLGGLGGDELNAGEYEYFIFHFADLIHGSRLEEYEHEVQYWVKYHDHPIHKKSEAYARESIQRLTDSQAAGVVIPDKHRLSRYYSMISREFYDLNSFRPILDHPFRSWLNNRTYQDIFRETAPCCLRAEDRNCVAFGLDHADPFFDYRLMEFMFRVPGHLKIRDGITKRLLRAAMQGILPEETRTRIKKTGWNAPAHVWFSGEALTELQDLIASKRFRERGVFDVVKVRQLLVEHLDIVNSDKPRENHMMFFWQLVNLELWMQYVDEIRSGA